MVCCAVLRPDKDRDGVAKLCYALRNAARASRYGFEEMNDEMRLGQCAGTRLKGLQRMEKDGRVIIERRGGGGRDKMADG